ncbi:hypothetical protein CIRMBP1196_02492 [Enterococcus cecorum]|nr:hypothetical protein CIRMBP1196_02492 [Enterococcus cecorum]
MKMIEVLQLISEGKIKKGTRFVLGDNLFIFNGDRFKAGNFYLGGRIFLNARDLNREVDLILPKENKYQLKLYKEDDLSYVTRSSYDSDFNYDLGEENEIMEFITKFTQEEIDNDKFLKFIEQHGIKEEVED